MSIGCLDVDCSMYIVIDHNLFGTLKKTVIASEKIMVKGDIRSYAEMLKNER